MTSVGNGYTAFVIDSNDIYIGGVFNGYKSDENLPSHRASIPNFQSIKLGSGAKLLYAGLDVENATYTRQYRFKTVPTQVTQVYYAHQTIRNILVQEITVDNSLNTDSDFQLDLMPNQNISSPDFVIDQVSAGGITSPAQYTATIITPELEDGFMTSVGITTSFVPDSVVVKAGKSKTFYFITSLVTNLESETLYLQQSMDIYKTSLATQDSLLDSHKDAWKKIWKSRIEIGGNLQLATVVNSSLYYILSSIREDWPWNLSPGSLSSNGYNGHSFWDCETWMLPSILVLHPKLIRDNLFQYRINNLDQAHLKALSYVGKNWTGYMFPWESAFTGTEVCPLSSLTGQLEHHVTGDIAFAMRQYFYSTYDTEWLNLNSGGYQAIKGMAQFWASRVETSNQNGSPIYVINDVIPPDEYAVGVNNSVYTNVVAKISLDWALEAASIVGDTTIPSQLWQSISNTLKIPYNETTNIHPEYDGFDGKTVKQADVILLGFPLMYNMTKQTRLNDLLYYEPITDPNGPAMTHSMFVVGWLEVGRNDKAALEWPLSYANSKAPFGVWCETPQGGTVNFITGAGGWLQSLIFGFGGLRIKSTDFQFTPQLPPDTTSMKIKDVHYLGAKFDVFCSENEISVEMTSNDNNLEFTLEYNQSTLSLQLQKQQILPTGTTFSIKSVSNSKKKSILIL
eukprot:gene8602-10589_t